MNFLKSAKLKYNLGRILRIAIFWSLGGAIDSLLLYVIRDSFYFVATERYVFMHHFLANVVSYFLVGLISGYLMIYWLRDSLRQLSFVANLLIQVVVMATVVMFLSIIMYTVFFSVVDELPLMNSEVLKSASELFLSSFNIRNTIFAFFLAIASVIFLNVNDKYGPGVLSAYFLGKYHTPKQEERIFMFVDMKDSTAIAEQIGSIKFHNLLNDFFRDLTDPVLYTKGEVCNYVGDEIIVSWKMKYGLNDFNCVRCYYAMQEAIALNREFYKEKYGLMPEFKAGLHCGEVTTGEIGVIKRDIVYSGDVLNTAARIQSKCNEFGVKILLSKYLLDKLNIPPHGIEQKKIGDIDLRGKKEKVILYSLEEWLKKWAVSNVQLRINNVQIVN